MECDNCETKPAQFYCLTCQGNLCNECKETHETRRLTQGHEVILLTEFIKRRQVCHDVKGKTPCACDVKRNLKEERNKIENVLIPSLEKFRKKETEQRESLSRNMSDIIANFDNHCDVLIDRITQIKGKIAQRLERKQEEILDAIDIAIDQIDANINQLENRSSEIGEYLDEGYEDLSENLYRRHDEAKIFPKMPIVNIKDFHPGGMGEASLQAVIGKIPVFNIQ